MFYCKWWKVTFKSPNSQKRCLVLQCYNSKLHIPFSVTYPGQGQGTTGKQSSLDTRFPGNLIQVLRMGFSLPDIQTTSNASRQCGNEAAVWQQGLLKSPAENVRRTTGSRRLSLLLLLSAVTAAKCTWPKITSQNTKIIMESEVKHTCRECVAAVWFIQ